MNKKQVAVVSTAAILLLLNLFITYANPSTWVYVAVFILAIGGFLIYALRNK